MIKILSIDNIKEIIHRKQLKNFFLELIERLKQDFSRWPEFQKTPRHATHYPHGVIELMPISDHQLYSFKYVNGHPGNPQNKKLNVVAVGLLADVASGYPLLISEMTLLTALRTAAVSALASSYLAQTKPRSFAIIGAGSQSEFQVLAHHFALGIEKINYFDIDHCAMEKFATNLSAYPLHLQACASVSQAIQNAEIITTATAAKKQAKVLEDLWIRPGTHINAIGGDCPGKTELDPGILSHSKIVVESWEQTQYEGEVQNQKPNKVYAELWEIVSNQKPGRQNPEEIFIFDSVGFALEDFIILKYINELAEEYSIGDKVDLIPELSNPKNLFGLLT